jgi:hypothetical protein
MLLRPLTERRRSRGRPFSSSWFALFDSLWYWLKKDEGSGRAQLVNGVCIEEWIRLWEHDWDEVDRLLLEYETIGG